MSPHSLLVTTFLCGISHASTITWGPATNVSTAAGNSSDVSNTGTLVEAYNAVANDQITAAAPITVNGVTFTPTTSLLNADPRNAGNNDFSSNTNTGDATYDSLLSTVEYGGGTDLVALTLGDGDGDTSINGAGLLTIGTTYEIQVWYVDTRTGTDPRETPVGDGAGNKVALNDQFAIGTFTADATTQTITLESPDFGQAHINAYQIREAFTGPPPAPVVPANLIITTGNNSAFLDWDDYGQPGFLEFRISRSTTMGGPYTQIGTSSSSSFIDSTAVNDTTYYYTVTSVNLDNLESGSSPEVDGTPVFTPEPPNFLFIIADDMDTYALNAYRNSEAAENDTSNQPYPISTPNLDRLAAEGMLFHQARFMGSWTGAVCTGTRSTIMTGRNTWAAEIDRAGAGNPANTFPGIFNVGARSGQSPLPHATYRTCKNGNSYDIANNAFTIRNDSTKRGNSDGSGSEWHGDRSLEHIEHWRTNHRPAGTPFLMYLGFSHPHDERNARPDLATFYSSVNTRAPETLALDLLAPPLPINHLPVNEADGIPANFPFHPFDNGHLSVRDEITAPGILQYRTEAVVRNEIGRNFACVDWIDQQLGRVFDKLEDPDGDGDTSDSVLDNTYIVFTSDHGIAIGRHGLQGKQNLYEHTWKVPYIVRGPGIAAGTETDALVYLHDSFPTFCDLAGLDLPSTIDEDDGQSFRAVLEGNANTARSELYGLYAGGSQPGMRSVTNGRFKLIKYDVDSNATQAVQMFDLETNPFELLPEHGTPNIAFNPAYAAIRQQLEELLMKQRVLNDDVDAFLGDRTLIRFEGDLTDRLPFENHGTSVSGTGSALPLFSNNTPSAIDFVIGEDNTLSLDLEQDLQHFVEIPDSRELDFANTPFTIEAWVKLETLPSGDNIPSAMPLVMKKVIGSNDSELDYLFLAAAGNYGNATTFDRLAIHLGSGLIISSLSIPDTEWHHISVALDPVNDTVRFTLDDQVDTQTTTLAGGANNGPLIIGSHYNSAGNIDSSFDGCIDELSIIDGFLSLAEIQPLSVVANAAPFAITSTQFGTSIDTISLTFESDDTRLYNIQRSTTLEPNSWTDIQTFIPGATGQTQTTITDLPITPNAQQEFFRVSTRTGL